MLVKPFNQNYCSIASKKQVNRLSQVTLQSSLTHYHRYHFLSYLDGLGFSIKIIKNKMLITFLLKACPIAFAP